MNATFVMSPLLLLFAIVGVIGFIMLITKLIKSNPKNAAMLLIVPIVFIALFVLMKFFGTDANIDFAPKYITLFVLIGGLVAFVMFFIKLSNSNNKSGVIILTIPAALILISIILPAISYRPVRVSEIPERPEPLIVNTERSPNYSSSDNSPIWSEGIENEFEADVYPSGISALKALAPRVVKNIPYVMGETGSPETIVIYTTSISIENAEEFRQTLSKLVPEIKCKIEIGNINLNENELGIRFSLPNKRQILNNQLELNQNSTGINQDGTSGIIQAHIYSGVRNLDFEVNYTNKSWVENFSSFINSQPNKNYIVAKSNETSMIPEEAEWQAMENAIDVVGTRLVSYLNPNKLEDKDIRHSGIIVDKFLQSFDTSTGKIWREAILLDASPAKLTQLANRISNTNREETMDWARMIFSIVGLFVLIVIAYAFLNAATKGYYSLTLKITGVILALIFLFIILTLT
ncbi:MAG: hypothetical protein JXA96_09465 [Sedimentisphaerales bacterium]|nr:hypothetical protein [Sedimentisphaerales bacterium]